MSDEKVLKDAGYDPCFMLPFALHTLSSGWINAEDFVLKGLLALTLVSIASLEEDMRKLGYDILASFFTLLEVTFFLDFKILMHFEMSV